MDELNAKIEIWKKIVDVQQHFNDLELRIRNFALIVTGAFLGLGGYAIKDGGSTHLGGMDVSTASIIIGASLIPLCAFYLMDRLWYHRLLDGAVSAGVEAERQLNSDHQLKDGTTMSGISVNLGQSIKEKSPFRLWIFGGMIHSRHKMDGFYGLLGVAIIALTITLASATSSPKSRGNSLDDMSLSEIVAQSAIIDRAAAKKICDLRVKQLLNRSASSPGSLVTDPDTGNQAVLVSGQWELVPKCR
ncbi:hypothetical protein [Stenotrophomonas sp. PSU-St15]